MELDWTKVRERYENGAVLDAVFGSARYTVTGCDDGEIRFEARLWQQSVPRRHFEEAVQLLADGTLRAEPSAFMEGFRVRVEVDPEVDPGCSKIPNLVGVVLKDLGYLGAAAD